MTSNGWITSLEAWRRAQEAGFTKSATRTWAKSGRLRSRAKSGTFSSDIGAGPDEPADALRIFPSEPPSDETKRSVKGPWPDIPKEFWEGDLVEAEWDDGNFTSRIREWCEYTKSWQHEIIRLYGVTFHSIDFQHLTAPEEENTARGKMPIHAKKNNLLYEHKAHIAANLIRNSHKSKAEAFREVLENEPPAKHVVPSSQERALRNAYDLMYDAKGMPHPD